MRHLLSFSLQHDQDVVTARQRAVQIAALLGFDLAEQTRIATAVSEIVRNAFRYADQSRIFDEFTQLEHRLQLGVGGTGLGLALSRRLSELLGGRLSVESEPGVGSTFRLTIPVRYVAADAETLPPPR